MKGLERWIGKKIRGICKSEKTFCGNGNPCKYEGVVVRIDTLPTLGKVLRVRNKTNGEFNAIPGEITAVKTGDRWENVVQAI